LAKYNSGGSTLEQHHEIEEKEKKRKESLFLILSNMFENFHFYLHIWFYKGIGPT
jgi:hypothetical protein